MGEDLSREAYLIGASHDFGKATTFFQKYVRAEGREHRTVKRRHSSLSAYFCYYLISRQIEEEPKKTGLMGWFAIQRHHNNLTDLSLDPEDGELYDKTSESQVRLLKEQIEDILSNSLEEVKEIYKALGLEVDLRDFASRIQDESIFRELRRAYLMELRKPSLENYHRVLFIYSILLDADKLDAAGVALPERRELPPGLVESYKRAVFGEPERAIDGLRQLASLEVRQAIAGSSLDQRFFSITLPTGMGKTLTGLDAVLYLRERIRRERGFTPRVIYSLPFLSIIDQNHGEIEKVLEENGIEAEPAVLLKHHYLSTGFQPEDDLEGAQEAMLLTEGWHSEVVVTTFVQFFESLITQRNSMARKFHSMANSVILLDEVQNIPFKYWGLLKEALKTLCEGYNSWVVLMTATNPLIFEPGAEIKELVRDRKRYYSAVDRVDYAFRLKNMGLEQLAGEVVGLFHSEPSSDIMVVMNTIKSSKTLYKLLKEELEGHIDGDDLIYLSTHVLPSKRMERIKRIKQKPRKRVVVVSTQLVEAGVDIDLDIVYRDMAPLDSVIQAAGRCNRESVGGRGRVHVVKLLDEDRGRTYASYIYDSVLLGITEEVIGDRRSSSEAEFNLAAAEDYFKKCRKRAVEKDETLDHLKKLNFSKASDFRLIEEYKTVQVFIELNDEAREVRDRVEEVLKDLRGYKKRSVFLPFKSSFYSYVLNVRVPVKDKDILGFLEELDSFKGIHVVKHENLEEWYDEEIGFKLPVDTFDMRIE